jgi:hypothetical protein
MSFSEAVNHREEAAQQLKDAWARDNENRVIMWNTQLEQERAEQAERDRLANEENEARHAPTRALRKPKHSEGQLNLNDPSSTPLTRIVRPVAGSNQGRLNTPLDTPWKK